MQPGQMKNGSPILLTFHINRKNLYLSAICDLFNKRNHCFPPKYRNDLQLVIDTLEKARKVRKTKGVLHSDQGYQYTSRHFSKLETIQDENKYVSKRNCLDNACTESFFGHFKSCSYIQSFESEEALKPQINTYGFIITTGSLVQIE
ncbi:DDE-type integrase/transposase/recombinase [Paenibacillus larvae]|uniref:DDE-type integrase/transposase/recombinase n=1 Tax=Paenibacillus larvae TaxID=1464 RepID=UPI0037C6ABDA